ncbi:hypothetical protein QBC35DRAFT_480805 [Podospora australis]|uniref:Uncharacterized protein n=1 Tax=Podospora australis TaxID=1536484 RepID=A0AAN7ANF4_9PEZI|nr:hypothetical protein QBC35DRAFT_480805 [Podospora australis]
MAALLGSGESGESLVILNRVTLAFHCAFFFLFPRAVGSGEWVCGWLDCLVRWRWFGPNLYAVAAATCFFLSFGGLFWTLF